MSGADRDTSKFWMAGAVATFWTILSPTIGIAASRLNTTPPALQPGAVSLNGRLVTPTPVDIITTASGRWHIDYLARVLNTSIYRWQREGATATRVMLCRDAGTVENRDSASLSLQKIDVQIGPVLKATAVTQGSCRIVEDAPLVQLNIDWLVQAVRDGRLPLYTNARSWIAPYIPPLATVLPYDPAVLGVADDATLPASAAHNFVGVTSGQGGEYTASRGFVHNVDARVVDLAVNAKPVGDLATLVRFSWESLAQPQGAVWSKTNHVIGDPQFPDPGDRPYSTNSPDSLPSTDTLVTVKNWGRDVFHLEDTCYVHWITAGDPVAGLCVQRQLAYALSQYPEAYRTLTPTSYAGNTGQIRGILNTLSALWKSRDVAEHMTSDNGHVLWRTARIDRMTADVFANYDPLIAPVGSPLAVDQVKEFSQTLSGNLGIGFFQKSQTQNELVVFSSNFELVQYGKEPLYLWTRFGNPIAAKWFGIGARHIAARVELIGGARGINLCSPLIGLPNGINQATVRDSEAGSKYPVGNAVLDGRGNPFPGAPAWADIQGWAAWMSGLCPHSATDRYDGAQIHTLTQAEGLLLLARAVGITGLDSALTRIAEDRARTDLSKLVYISLNMPKHWAAPIEGSGL